MEAKSDASFGGAVSVVLAFAKIHDLRQRAERSCRVALRSIPEHEFRGCSSADVRIEFERTALVVDHGLLGYPFVETRLGLYVADTDDVWFRGQRPIGHYRLITLLDGTDGDDYLVLDG